MRALLLLTVACLTGCATPSIVVSTPKVPDEYLEKCPERVAARLAQADQYDLARALVDSVEWGRACKARFDALIEAVKARQQLAGELEQHRGSRK